MLSLVALAALGGCFAQLTQARCWSGPWAQAGMLLGAWLWAVALWAWRRWRSGGAQALAVLCMVVGTALLAWGQTEVRAIARLQAVLQPELEGQELLLVGKVVDMPQVTADGVQFVFEVEQAQDLAAPSAVVQVPQRLWLTWRRGWQEDALLAGPPEALQAGSAGSCRCA
ncbi:DUF4131 domain-containing protein [Ideonella paludis]|uniref:DUF4131 domain-containing protein n=1 Tax=Ideonella paludis TaxID=1233411 RepID=UPI0036404217